MVRTAARAAHAPARQPAQQLGLGDVEVDHRVERLAEVLQQSREGLRLGDGPRKAVEDEAPRRVAPAEALGHQPNDHIVGDERAVIHVALGFDSDCRAGRHRLAQHVAGREVGHAPLAREVARLGALAGSRRSEKRNAHAQLRANAPERDLDRFRKPS